MSARLHLTSCTTAEIADAHAHRVAEATHLDTLAYAVEVAVKRIRRDVLPRTQGPRRDYLASISVDLDKALDVARTALAALARAEGAA